MAQNTVTALCGIPHADVVAQSSEDKILRVWDARNLAVTLAFPRQQYIHVRHYAGNHSERRLFIKCPPAHLFCRLAWQPPGTGTPWSPGLTDSTAWAAT